MTADSAALDSRPPEEIFADLQKMSRRARPLLLLGLLVIVVALGLSTVYLSRSAATERSLRDGETRLRQEAEARAVRWQAQSKSLTRVIEEARREAEAGNLQQVRQLLATAQGETRILAASTGDEARPAQLPLEAMRVDLFYCVQGGDRTRALAERALGLRPAGFTGPWRVRPLSERLNAVEPYRIGQNEIRYNASEVDAAGSLQKLLGERLGVAMVNRYNTRESWNYVTAFFCDGVTPPAAPQEG